MTKCTITPEVISAMQDAQKVLEEDIGDHGAATIRLEFGYADGTVYSTGDKTTMMEVDVA